MGRKTEVKLGGGGEWRGLQTVAATYASIVSQGQQVEDLCNICESTATHGTFVATYEACNKSHRCTFQKSAVVTLVG